MQKLRTSNPLANEFLSARFEDDSQGIRNPRDLRPMAKYVDRHSNRSSFHRIFEKLKKAGCREDMLLACLRILIDSQNAKVAFPWREDFEPIYHALAKSESAILPVMKQPGFQTLASSVQEPSLATFTDFMSAQRGLLRAVRRYRVELDQVRTLLPRKKLIQQYGRAVVCLYVRVATGRPSYALVQDLLSFFTTAQINLLRDMRNFQGAHPEFCESTSEFLKIEHDRKSAPSPLDWSQFVRA